MMDTNQEAEIINNAVAMLSKRNPRFFVCIAGFGLLHPHLLQVFGRWLHLISDDKRADKQYRINYAAKNKRAGRSPYIKEKTADCCGDNNSTSIH
jgi:hypothetical protein